MDAVDSHIENFTKLAILLETKLGLNYPESKWSELAHKIMRLSRSIGFGSVEDCVSWLVSGSDEEESIDRLISVCTIGETYFFREQNALDRLRDAALPEFVRAARLEHRPVRIWSAGCCTGEEPYSLSILLMEAHAQLGQFEFEICGTDVNPDFIEKARAGGYRAWSFRKTSEAAKSLYFVQEGDTHRIRDDIRSHVTFDVLNLAESHFPAPFDGKTKFDAIFCRNVLMYFTPDATRNALNRFQACLQSNGWIIVSATETSILSSNGYSNRCLPHYAGHGERNKDFPRQQSVQDSPTLVEFIKPAFDLTKVTAPLPRFSEPESGVTLTDPESSVPVKNSVDAEPSVHESVIDVEKEARRLVIDGEFGEAKRRLENTNIYDSSTETRLLYARVSHLCGDFDTAYQFASRVIEEDRLCPEAYRILGLIRHEGGDLHGAIESLQRAIYIEPDSAVLHMHLGFILRDTNQSSLCQKHFRNAEALFEGTEPGTTVPELGDLTAKRLARIAHSMAHGGHSK